MIFAELAQFVLFVLIGDFEILFDSSYSRPDDLRGFAVYSAFSNFETSMTSLSIPSPVAPDIEKYSYRLKFLPKLADIYMYGRKPSGRITFRIVSLNDGRAREK
jgi:hypothetical protein